MTLVGADVDQLRALAQRFEGSAEALGSAVKTLSSLTSDTSRWRGSDADRFRAEWASRSVPAVNGVVDGLRNAAEALRRHAGEQVEASSAGGGASPATGVGATGVTGAPAPHGLSGLWDEVSHVSKADDSAGYRIQTVTGSDGKERYIVYIGGTDSSEGQSKIANVAAANGYPDDKQLAALRTLIPDGAEVMLVGYSQGGWTHRTSPRRRTTASQ